MNFNTTGSSFSINPTANLGTDPKDALSLNSTSNQNQDGITGSVIQTIASPAGIGAIGSLALVAAVAVIITSRRDNKLKADSKEK